MDSITRRTALAAAAAGITAASVASAQSQEPFDQVIVTEDQYGDPDVVAVESVTFDAIKVQSIGGTKAKFEPRIADFDKQLIAVAQRYVGKGRQNDRQDISNLLGLFGLPFQLDGKPVPFCAAGVSNMAAIAYCEARGQAVDRLSWNTKLQPLLPDIDHHHFYPSPSVLDIYYVAQGKHRWIKPGVTPQPGWLVIYDWKKNGGADHVGIVESATPTTLSTIEFNTGDKNFRDGGQIARKQRRRDATVKGFVNTSLRTRV